MSSPSAKSSRAKAADEFASGKGPKSKRTKGAVEEEDEGAALVKLVEGHEDLEFFRDGSKVRCKLPPKHEMPAVLSQVREFINGPKYVKHKSMYSVDFSMHEPHIIRHQYKKKFLYCTLTKTTLPMDPKKVAAHVESGKYKATVTERAARDVRRKAKVQKRRLEMRRPRPKEGEEGYVAPGEKGDGKKGKGKGKGKEAEVKGKLLAKKKPKKQEDGGSGGEAKIKEVEKPLDASAVKAKIKEVEKQLGKPDVLGKKKRRREGEPSLEESKLPAESSAAPEGQPNKKKKKAKA